MLRLIIAILMPIGMASSQEGPLRRRAEWPVTFARLGGDSGLVVSQIRASGSARSLRAGDRITAINGIPASDTTRFTAERMAMRGGDQVDLEIVRDGTTGRARLVLDSVPHEKIPGTTATYSAITTELGHRLRVVINRPETSGTRRLPAALFIPWLSCDPVEKPIPGSDGFAHMLRGIAAESRLMLIRVEKPGVGDSEGPACRDAPLAAEMAGYRAALRMVRRRTDVDTTAIFLLGGSIGGGLAPILAAEDPRGIIGVISAGGFSKTWLEHMLELERRRLGFLKRSSKDINQAMRGFARFYSAYLEDRQTPAQVLRVHPELRDLWYDEPTHQYGRAAAYYHEVQQLNVEGAWERLAELGIPGLMVWGEFDWIMSRSDQEQAAAILNGKRPRSGTLVVLKNVDHGLMTFSSAAAAFADDGGRYDGSAHAAVNAWLRSTTTTAASRK